MKLTLIGRSQGYAVERFAAEAEKCGVELVIAPLSSVVLKVHDNKFSLHSSVAGDISDSDCYLFRGVGDADEEVMVIAKYLMAHGATIIEEKTANGALMMDKLFLRATEQQVPTPDYFLIQGTDALTAIIAQVNYPSVVKATVGSMGKKVALVHDQDQLREQYEVLGPRVVVQEFIPADHDIRAIVVGGSCIGAYLRTRDDGEFRMNRPGNHQEAIDLPPEAVEICERAATSQNIEVAGIDLVEYDGKWYVLEINTSSMFKQFEKRTGVNVARAILEYAVRKTGQEQSAN